MNVTERLTAFLDQRAIAYERLEHEAVFTSAEAAQIRGTTLSSGAKALICKTDDRFVMFVMPADRKLANKLVRGQLGSRQLRFASAEEVLEMTGLRPGSIPPFGSLFGLKTYCDEGLADESRINFNAGDHCISLSLAFSDYAAVEQPQMGRFAEPAKPEP
jgi:Ala-tRNA(Pro) deacylase